MSLEKNNQELDDKALNEVTGGFFNAFMPFSSHMVSIKCKKCNLKYNVCDDGSKKACPNCGTINYYKKKRWC